MLLRLLLQIKRLYLLLTVKESAVDVPTNLEARRRIAFFTNSLFMDMPRAPRVRKMLSFRFRALLSRSYCCKLKTINATCSDISFFVQKYNHEIVFSIS